MEKDILNEKRLIEFLLEDVKISFYNLYSSNKLNELNDEMNYKIKVARKMKANYNNLEDMFLIGKVEGLIEGYIDLLNEKLKIKEKEYQLKRRRNKNDEKNF